MNGRRKRREVLDWAGAVFLSGVLLFGLIASPWIVECIPEDGKVLVELLGQDPCHQCRGHFTAANHRAADTYGQYDPTGMCLDVVLDNLGFTQNGVDLYVPMRARTDQLSALPVAGESLPAGHQSLVLFKLAREPVKPVKPGAGLSILLRI